MSKLSCIALCKSKACLSNYYVTPLEFASNTLWQWVQFVLFCWFPLFIESMAINSLLSMWYKNQRGSCCLYGHYFIASWKSDAIALFIYKTFGWNLIKCQFHIKELNFTTETTIAYTCNEPDRNEWRNLFDCAKWQQQQQKNHRWFVLTRHNT